MEIEIYILLLLVGTIIMLIFKIYKLNYNNKVENSLAIIDKNILKQNPNDLLLKLINNNDPQFIILFISHYPLFVKKMQMLNPNISNNELTFLAFCYLDLSNKKISEITFVTEGAVAMRKNRIKKKYNINVPIPFNQWIQEYVNS